MDHYLEDRTRLKGQPKRTISDYVERNGILVPRRFETVSEVRQAGVEPLFRSEHEQEYDGVSGLLESFGFDSYDYPIKDAQTVDEIKEIYFDTERANRFRHPTFRQYCEFTGTDEQEFIDGVSYSIWERLGGYNVTVTEDSSIKGRYHVMSFSMEKLAVAHYFQLDGERKEMSRVATPPEVTDRVDEILDMYEAVRGLPHFNPNHCPIIEMQVFEGRVYFLQYHRARDMDRVGHVIERGPLEEELEVPFVRGHTGPEGKTSKVTLHYAGEMDWNFETQGEEGSFDSHLCEVFSELQLRKRKLQMIDIGETSLDWAMLELGMNHERRSKIFKPEVTVLGDLRNLTEHIENDKRKVMRRMENGKNTFVDLHIVSDGRRAYVKRV